MTEEKMIEPTKEIFAQIAYASCSEFVRFWEPVGPFSKQWRSLMNAERSIYAEMAQVCIDFQEGDKRFNTIHGRNEGMVVDEMETIFREGFQRLGWTAAEKTIMASRKSPILYDSCDSDSPPWVYFVFSLFSKIVFHLMP